jgi:hypothetical protein
METIGKTMEDMNSDFSKMKEVICSFKRKFEEIEEKIDKMKVGFSNQILESLDSILFSFSIENESSINIASNLNTLSNIIQDVPNIQSDIENYCMGIKMLIRSCTSLSLVKENSFIIINAKNALDTMILCIINKNFGFNFKRNIVKNILLNIYTDRVVEKRINSVLYFHIEDYFGILM